MKPIGQGENKVSPSIEGFNRYLAEALARNAFDQLILVGSNSDISWTHHTLPEAAHKNIIAEIKYPLVPEWFRQNGLKQISIALEQLLSA